MDTKSKQISNDFAILLYIYEQTEIQKEIVNFSKIVKETQFDQKIASKSVDRLYDNLMIDASWQKIENGYWAYCFSVSDEFKGFAKALYNVTEHYCEKKTHKTESKNIVEMIEKRNIEKHNDAKEIKSSKKENEFK